MDALLLLVVSVLFFHLGWSVRSAKAEKKECEIYWRVVERAPLAAYYAIYGEEPKNSRQAAGTR